jgi:hypothetical protein
MDLKSGVAVSIGSVPFHVPVSPREGKFPLVDMRYYYITARNPAAGQLETKLYICHSGFYFSPKNGHCVPTFLQEYFLAGSSYQLGVDLAQQANVRLSGSGALNGQGIGLHANKLVKLSVGNPSLIQNPNPIFGAPVSIDKSVIDVAPCLVAGYQATPDYRFYYTCMTKTFLGTDKEANSKENSIEHQSPHQNLNNDNSAQNDEYIQTLYECPPGLYYSDSYGFCVAPYLHQFIGMGHRERYIWGGNRLHQSLQVNSDGYEWDANTVPWEIPRCTKDGKIGIRDPRYYISCAQGAAKIFICPTNTYFNHKTGKCSPITLCNCWFQVGYFSDPYPPTGLGDQMSIQIHLDRAYLNLLRKMNSNAVRRVTMGSRGDGKDLTLLTRLVCFWREMEKLRTLRYSNTSPSVPQRQLPGPIPHPNLG